MVGIHFCGGKTKNVAFLSNAEDCGMEKKVPPCHRHLSKPCCEDEAVVHEGEGFKASFHEFGISSSPAIDIDLPQVVLAEIIPADASLQIQYYDYDPPLRSSNLTVVNRVFLI
jgi:hypothetical protein